MKILHIGRNVGSQMTISVQALRSIGERARGIAMPLPGEIYSSQSGLEMPPPWRDRRSIGWFVDHSRRYWKILSAIAWADVIHWHFAAGFLRNDLDLRWPRFLGKPGVIEFWGSDIRIAKIEAMDNPYFARYAPADYLNRQSEARSRQAQEQFSAAGLRCLIGCKSTLPHVYKELYPAIYLIRQRMILEDYTPQFPDPGKKTPLIVHCPSNPKLKGTEFVLAAVETLRQKHDFEFRLIHDMSHQEAIAAIASADIFVDQILFGYHGIAAIEGMALGKPTVCYIKDTMMAQYPSELPLVNATPDTIQEVLANLIQDGALRHDLGVRGRAYAEKHHDSVKLARELRAMYAELIGKSQPGSNCCRL